MCCFHYLKVVVGVEVVIGWHLALHHFPDSAVMAIPVELRQPPGSTDETIMCVEVVLDALLVPVVVTAVKDIVGLASAEAPGGDRCVDACCEGLQGGGGYTYFAGCL